MSECIFCKIANGEIPSNTIYENDNFRVILDISPANPGHCLILPKNHANDIFELNIDMTKEAFGLSKKIAEAIKSANIAEGINILQNNGESAGQTVNHFHIHVIPRKTDDKVVLKHEPSKLSDNEMNDIKKILTEKIQQF